MIALLLSTIFYFENFDSLPPNVDYVGQVERTPYPLSSYGFSSNVSEDTLLSAFVTVHEEYTPLNDSNAGLYTWFSHGRFSLWLMDTSINMSAHAERKITPVYDDTFMVEFYIWVNRVECGSGRLYLFRPLLDGNDFGCYLSLVNLKGNERYDTFDIEVGHSGGISTRRVILPISYASGIYYPWHKFQLMFEEGRVVLYIDGDSIMTFDWTPVLKFQGFAVGTFDTLSNAEIFFDDFIITTVPRGEHPRLFFNEYGLDSIRVYIQNHYNDILPCGITYSELIDRAYQFQNQFNFVTLLEEMVPSDFAINGYFNAISHALNLELRMLLTILDEGNFYSEIDSVKKTAVNWAFWDMCYKEVKRYGAFCKSNILEMYTLLYDWFFDSLTAYEKMNIQNACLVHGAFQNLQVIYRLIDPEDNWYWLYGGTPPINYPARELGPTGLFFLVLDDTAFSSKWIRKSREWSMRILSNNSPYKVTIDPVGGITHEGTVYSDGTTFYPLLFLKALSRIEPDVLNSDSLTLVRDSLPHGFLHIMLPEPNIDGGFLPFEDRGGRVECSINTLVLDNNMYNDNLSSYILKRVNKKILRRADIDGPGSPYTHILFINSDAQPVQTDSSLDMYFPHNGWVCTRSGWDTSDVFVAFKTDSFHSHQHNAMNHFIFTWNKYYLITDDIFSYKNKAIDHNTLLNGRAEAEDSQGYPHFWRRGKPLKVFSDSVICLYEGFVDSRVQYNEPYHGRWIRKGVFVKPLKSLVLYDWGISEDSTALKWRLRFRPPGSAFYSVQHGDTAWDYIYKNDTTKKFIMRFLYPDDKHVAILDGKITVGFWDVDTQIHGGPITAPPSDTDTLLSPETTYVYHDTPKKEVEFLNMLGFLDGKRYSVNLTSYVFNLGAQIENFVVVFSEKVDTLMKCSYVFKNNDSLPTYHFIPDFEPLTEYFCVINNDTSLIKKDTLWSDENGLISFKYGPAHEYDSLHVMISRDITPPSVKFKPDWIVKKMWGKKFAAGGKYPFFQIRDDISGSFFYRVYGGNGLLGWGRDDGESFAFTETTLSGVSLRVEAFDSMFNKGVYTAPYGSVDIGPLYCPHHNVLNSNNQRKTTGGERPVLVYEVNGSVILSDSTDKWRNHYLGDGHYPCVCRDDSLTHIVYAKNSMVLEHLVWPYTENRREMLIEEIFADTLYHHRIEPPSFLLKNDTIFTLVGVFSWKRVTEEDWKAKYRLFLLVLPSDTLQGDTCIKIAHYEKIFGHIPDTLFYCPSITLYKNGIYCVWNVPDGFDSTGIWLYDVSSDKIMRVSDTSFSHSPYAGHYADGIDIVWINNGNVLHRFYNGDFQPLDTICAGDFINPQIINGNVSSFQRDSTIYVYYFNRKEWVCIDSFAGTNPFLFYGPDSSIGVMYKKHITGGWKIDIRNMGRYPWHRMDDIGLLYNNQRKVVEDTGKTYVYFTDSGNVYRCYSESIPEFSRDWYVSEGAYPSCDGGHFIIIRGESLILDDSVVLKVLPEGYIPGAPDIDEDNGMLYIALSHVHSEEIGDMVTAYYTLEVCRYEGPENFYWTTVYDTFKLVSPIPPKYIAGPDIVVDKGKGFIAFDNFYGVFLAFLYDAGDSVSYIGNGVHPSLYLEGDYLNLLFSEKPQVKLMRINLSTWRHSPVQIVGNGFYPVSGNLNTIFYERDGYVYYKYLYLGGEVEIDKGGSPQCIYKESSQYILCVYNGNGKLKVKKIPVKPITFLSGNVKGKLEGNCYITGDITVPYGDTLLLEENTKFIISDFNDKTGESGDIKVRVDGVMKASGVEFTGEGWYGIVSSGHLEIKECTISGADTGIVSSGNSKIYKNMINAGIGIASNGCDSIIGNRIVKSKRGIIVEGEGAFIGANMLSSCDTGMVIKSNVEISGNVFNGCKVDLAVFSSNPILGNAEEGIGGCNVFTGESLFISGSWDGTLKAEGNWWDGDSVLEKISGGEIDISPVALSGTLENNTTLMGNQYITGTLKVPEGISLVVKPGTRLFFVNNYSTEGDSFSGLDISGNAVIGPDCLFRPAVITDEVEWKGITLHSPVSIMRNKIISAETGIYTTSVLSIIKSSILNSNTGVYVDTSGICTMQKDTVKGCDIGIMVRGEISVRKSVVMDNNTGVYVDRNANADMGIGCGKNILVNDKWNIYNNTGNDIYAKKNWWGTTDTAVIGKKIYGKKDAPEKGEVLYIPILEDMSGLSQGDFLVLLTPEIVRVENNISRGIFKVKLLHPGGMAQFELFDITGRRISEKEIEVNRGMNSVTLNFNLPDGIYFLRIKGRRNRLHKLILIR